MSITEGEESAGESVAAESEVDGGGAIGGGDGERISVKCLLEDFEEALT